MPVAATLAGLLAGGSVVFAALPFLRGPRHRREDAQQERRLAHLVLLERRDRALAALKELELDHRTGKLADRDYRALVGPLRREAAQALRLLDGAEPGCAA